MKTIVYLLVALVAALLLILIGCTTSPVTTLELAVGAAEVAIPLIPGVPPAIAAAVESYLSATSTAITQASTILAGPGTDAQKAAAITQAFAGIAAPVVPPQYQALATAVQKIAGYVAQFLITSGSAVSTTTAGSPTHAPSAKDAGRLTAVKARAQAVIGKVRH